MFGNAASCNPMVAVLPPDPALDRLLRALSDRSRRGLLDRLRDTPGLTLSALLEGFGHSRQALSKQLAVLEAAGLVVPVWRGREKLHFLDPAPLHLLPARWVTTSVHEDAVATSALRQALAATPAPTASKLAPGASPDPVLETLLRPAGEPLAGQPVIDAGGLDAARRYLAQTAEAVQLLRDALPADAGYAQPSDGGFSLAEHLWHLADIETLGWRRRFERILAGPGARLAGVDGDRLAIEQRYQQRPWRGAARRFLAQRRASLVALAAFDERLLSRAVVFAGARTRAGAVIAAAVAHDLEHRTEMADRWCEHRASVS
jgi:DNA-binding transcriptional ArsR family regulator/uncharacterized damage-inducible protein DinB